MNKVRFSSIEIGQTFIAFGMKMKKMNEMSAMTLSERGKQFFIFRKNNLVFEDSFSIFIPKLMSVKIKKMCFSIYDRYYDGKNVFALAKEYQEAYHKKYLANNDTSILPLDRYDFSKKYKHNDLEDCLSGSLQKTISSLKLKIEDEYKIMENEPGMTYLKDHEKSIAFDEYIFQRKFNINDYKIKL